MAYVRRFQELFRNAEKPQAIVAYHGGKREIREFSSDDVDVAKEQDLPGIFFSSDENDARLYGPVTTKAALSITKSITIRDNSRAKREDVLYMIEESPIRDAVLQTLSDDSRKAHFMAVDSILRLDSALMMYKKLYVNFYNNAPAREEDDEKVLARGKHAFHVAFATNMVNCGIDGVEIPSTHGVMHYIVFNPESIKILK